MAAVARNRWYVALAAGLALFVVLGFLRTYYLRTLFTVPPIDLMLHLHALAFTAWVVLFVIQARLISKQNYKTHMQLGIAGMFVAAAVFVLGMITAVHSAALTRPRPMGMTGAQFAFLPIFAISLFAILVAAALFLRKRAQLHKRLMVLAMVSVLGPPAARLIAASGNGKHFLAIQTSVVAVFVIWCLITDWVRHRTLHPVYTIGGTLLVVSWPIRVWFAQTSAWTSAGNWLAGIS